MFNDRDIVDPDILPLVKTMNQVPWIETLYSCSGHDAQLPLRRYGDDDNGAYVLFRCEVSKIGELCKLYFPLTQSYSSSFYLELFGPRLLLDKWSDKIENNLDFNTPFSYQDDVASLEMTKIEQIPLSFRFNGFNRQEMINQLTELFESWLLNQKQN